MTGILLIDKEPDWTSHDVIAKLRGVLRERRMGHAGTLDPMATGLLVVLCGRATRAATFAEADEKEYVAALRPGISTDTQDITGRILTESALRPSAAEVAAVLPRFTGEIMQLPPMYSAIKIKGQKLYDIARRGGEVERKARKITIHSIDYLRREGSDHILRVRCSKGTYIRTLCHDIGAALGCGGTMAALRRTASGAFSIENAKRITEVSFDDRQLLLPVDTLFTAHAALTLTGAQERRLRCGNSFAADADDGRWRFYGESGEFLALCQITNGQATLVKSFYEVS